MGMTFKENVSDIRNSKVADIINEFKDFGAEVDVMDESYFMSITNEHAVLADVKGVYRGSIHQMIYWSL